MSNMKEKIKDWWKNGGRDGVTLGSIVLIPTLLLVSMCTYSLNEAHEKSKAISEHHVQLWKTHKYKIRQYHGKNGHNVFYTNSYTVEGSGIRFTNEENKEMFVGGNYIIISTH